MYSDGASCSDCKIELIEKRWNQLLLNWINRCVNPRTKVKQLNYKCLMDIIFKYRHDVCIDDIDRALLFSDDWNLEQFIKYKYPIYRLRNFTEEKDIAKRIYMTATILLFYCCINSQSGIVDTDICMKLHSDEQEMILRFCEILSDMEITVNNVDSAIKEACELVPYIQRYAPKRRPAKESLIMEDSIPSDTTIKPSVIMMPSDTTIMNTDVEPTKRSPTLKFKSSLTILPSVVTDTSSYSKSSVERSDLSEFTDVSSKMDNIRESERYSEGKDVTVFKMEEKPKDDGQKDTNCKDDDSESGDKSRCLPDCACSRCSDTGPCCGDLGATQNQCNADPKASQDENKKKKGKKRFIFNWKVYSVLLCVVFGTITYLVLSASIPYWKRIENEGKKALRSLRADDDVHYFTPNWTWQCKNHLCQKAYQPNSTAKTFSSLSRCSLLCMGPQLWPWPIGYTYFSKDIVFLATNKLEYKFQSVPSDRVHHYLAEAFKMFIDDLVRLEKIDMKSRKRENNVKDVPVKKMYIQIDVESDPEPRLKLNTEEAYNLKVDTLHNQVTIKLSSASFCGVRHGLETLSQLILLDQDTGYLITLSNVMIKDAPSYKYRGLMIDTGRNYIPVPDLLRTIDGMAINKLNTFHWRISDVTSFPLVIRSLPQLYEYGAYDRSMVYTKEDVKTIVYRAGIRGIRVVIEVAAPGPVGRPWSWSSDATCPTTKSDNYTCDNILCMRLKMQDSIFDALQIIYADILEITQVDDVFHLSDSIHSLSNCYFLLEQREGFLDKALDRLKMANKGFLPKLPIVWYTSHLMNAYEAKTWEMMGVQLTEARPAADNYLRKFKAIHSSKWDLSCEMRKQRCYKYRTWQEMYSWKSWRTIEVFTIEGGEAILWTDLVNSGNLDYHLWPRAAAVAERLWSDIVANNTVNNLVYVRLDSHRWRMLLRGVKVQPLWPVFCSFNPSSCLSKLKLK